MTGVIVNLQLSKGFGFVLPDGCSDRQGHAHFFHATDVPEGLFYSLTLQQPVEFESVSTAKGLRAKKVRPAKL
jgi:cold shock CspA family protein